MNFPYFPNPNPDPERVTAEEVRHYTKQLPHLLDLDEDTPLVCPRNQSGDKPCEGCQ